MTSQQSSGKQNRPRLLVRRVVGKSMWPVLDPGQIVVAMRRGKYEAEDVVLIMHQGREKIKRIRSLEGEKFDVRGDNPSQSTDSRHFGLIDKQDIIGKVVLPRV